MFKRMQPKHSNQLIVFAIKFNIANANYNKILCKPLNHHNNGLQVHSNILNIGYQDQSSLHQKCWNNNNATKTKLQVLLINPSLHIPFQALGKPLIPILITLILTINLTIFWLIIWPLRVCFFICYKSTFSVTIINLFLLLSMKLRLSYFINIITV